MADNEPMSDERLAEIRFLIETAPESTGLETEDALFAEQARAAILTLLAEVERLYERLRQTIDDREGFIRHATLQAKERYEAAEVENAQLRESLEQEQREHGNCEDFHFRVSEAKSEAMIALAEQNAAMRPIVEAVADVAALQGNGACGYCSGHRESIWNARKYRMELSDDFTHTPDCPVTLARAFVAAHPAK